MRKIVTVALLAVLAASCSKSSSTTSAASSASSATSSSSSASQAGGSMSATAYAHEVCGAMVDWVTALKSASPNVNPSSGAEATKQALTDYFDKVVSETDTLVNQLKAAGAPDVTGGAEASQTFTQAMEALQSAFHQLRDKVQGLDASNTATMMADLTTIMGDFQTQMSDIGKKLNGLQSNSELDAAFTADPTCKQLSKS